MLVAEHSLIRGSRVALRLLCLIVASAIKMRYVRGRADELQRGTSVQGDLEVAAWPNSRSTRNKNSNRKIFI